MSTVYCCLVCLFVCLFVWLFVSVCLFVCLFVFLFVAHVKSLRVIKIKRHGDNKMLTRTPGFFSAKILIKKNWKENLIKFNAIVTFFETSEITQRKWLLVKMQTSKSGDKDKEGLKIRYFQLFFKHG